jgi:endonuclease YncB( thermonuclease family)
VIDGDTIDIATASDPEHRVRLSAVDAPERDQAFGAESRQYMEQLISGKEVYVLPVGPDQHQRTVGRVLFQDTDIGLEQIKTGNAWYSRAYEKNLSSDDRTVYDAAEKEARSARRGLWAASSPIAPWDQRRSEENGRNSMTPKPGLNNNQSNRGGRQSWGRNDKQAQGKDRTATANSNQSRNQTGAASSSATTTTSKEIIGNRRSRIYHWPGCPNYDDVAPQNRVYFSNREEAEKAGYRAAKNCNQ